MKSFHEPFDRYDDLEELEDKKRRSRERLEKARIAKELEDKAEAKRLAQAIEFTQRSNERYLRREYEIAGVQPQHVDDKGNPTVSLSMLLRLGWRIETIGDENVLVEA